MKPVTVKAGLDHGAGVARITFFFFNISFSSIFLFKKRAVVKHHRDRKCMYFHINVVSGCDWTKARISQLLLL